MLWFGDFLPIKLLKNRGLFSVFLLLLPKFWWTNCLQKLLGNEYADFLASYNQMLASALTFAKTTLLHVYLTC